MSAVGAARAPMARTVAVPVVLTAEARAVTVHAAAWAAPPGQHGETPLLAVIEALVERLGCLGQFLHRRARLHHGGGAPVEAFGGIVTRRGIAHRVHAIGTQLAEVPRGLLERRPVLLLLGGQYEA